MKLSHPTSSSKVKKSEKNWDITTSRPFRIKYHLQNVCNHLLNSSKACKNQPLFIILETNNQFKHDLLKCLGSEFGTKLGLQKRQKRSCLFLCDVLPAVSVFPLQRSHSVSATDVFSLFLVKLTASPLWFNCSSAATTRQQEAGPLVTQAVWMLANYFNLSPI